MGCGKQQAGTENQDVLTALGQIYILNCHFEVVVANVIVVAGVVAGAKCPV